MKKTFLWALVWAVLILFSSWAFFGCASKVEGGSIRKEVRQGEERKAESGLRVTVAPDGAVEIITDRKAVATTRPSEVNETTGPSATSYGATPKTGSVTAGKLGGVSFEALENPANWPLFGAFLIAAAVMWKVVGSIPGAILCLGCALLAVLYPALLTWLAILCVVGVLVASYLKYRERLREFVIGGDNVILKYGAGAKVEMERAHSKDTKAAVRAVKGKA